MQPAEENRSVLTQIRQATHEQHQRAESLVGLPENLDQHVNTLKKFLGFIQPWEDSLQVVVPIDILRPRRKTRFLVNDLKSLGVDDLQAIPRCKTLPTLTDFPTALASMYVFEGATLGGQILSRHIEQKLGLIAGYSFYQSYGPSVGVMWRDFGALLTAKIPPLNASAAVASAYETFRLLCEWFESRSD